MTESIEHKQTLFEALPPSKKGNPLTRIQTLGAAKVDTIIVLDDDPTGTQTVHDIPVLTTWSIEELAKEFEKKTPLFYILTNSRSLTLEEAITLTETIGNHIKSAAIQTNTRYWIISRSDSTLRGYYPAEVEALQKSLDLPNSVQFIIPAFFEGGRYTVNDIHYVAQGEQLIPAAQTIYAKDHVFGYQSSNLIDWIVEKTQGSVRRDQITSLSIGTLRTSSTEALVAKINQLENGTVCIVNAATYEDLRCFSQAVLQSSLIPVFRTAASFVASLGGLDAKPLLEKKDVIQDEKRGGLIIVGSYVATTTQQLKYLLETNSNLSPIEIDIPQVLRLEDTKPLSIQIARQIDHAIDSGQSVVLYTSRNLISAKTDLEKQHIGKRVSHILTSIIRQIQIQPSFLLTKGGITSSDVATKGLGIKRAIVLGQIIKGVPVWQLGEETKFPNSVQIIFPGNVGEVSSLAEIVKKLSSKA